MIRFFILLIVLINPLTSLAGVEIGGSRLIYEGNARQAALSISNPDDYPYLIQAWVDKDPTQRHSDNTFIATPPLFRLEPHTQNSVRIVYTGAALPADRESLYWLSIKSVPGTPKEETNRLLITVKSVFKLFYRPAGLPGDAATAFEKITFRRQGDRIYASNPTPFYISFYELKMGNAKLKSLPVLSPLSEQAIDFPPGTAGTLSWRAINDYGGITDVRTAKI